MKTYEYMIQAGAYLCVLSSEQFKLNIHYIVMNYCTSWETNYLEFVQQQSLRWSEFELLSGTSLLLQDNPLYTQGEY